MGVKDTANLAMIPAAYAEDKVYSVLPSDGDGDFTFTRTGSGTRINKGGYIETMAENVPRLNYRLDADGNPTECAELLLEESRQNSLTYSEDFTQSVWSKQGTSSISSNTTIAPDGTLSADTLSGATGTSVSGSVLRRNVSGTSTATLSVFCKSLGSQYLTIYIRNGGTGSVTSQLIQLTSYWKRIELTANPNNGQIYIGNTDGNVAIWGAQMEVGSTMTSYIPTPSSSAITRNKDSAYNQPFGDLASDYPITVFWKGQITNYNAGAFAFSVYDNGSNVRYLGLAWNSTSNFYLYRRSTNNDADLVSYTTQIGDVKKIAIKFTSNTTAKVYIDGIEVYNLSSGLDVDWDFDSVLVGQQRVISDSAKRIPADELFVWNKALTDAEMVDVTSYDTFAEMATGQQYTIQ